MRTVVLGMKDYAVIVGNVVLHLSEYRLTGSCGIREQGTALGTGAVTACWPKGTRLVLKGKLSDTADIAEIAAALDAKLHSKVTMGVQLGRLLYTDARLIGYSIGEGADVPEVMLMLVTNTVLTVEENV